MARRLLSGWLIALAALARSLALMFERAAADRSELADDPDPVMTELAARYPGAPVHWLAHVAEGMARTAEAGEVPLSLTSDAMAWPEAAASSHEGPAPELQSVVRPVAGPPRHPISPPPIQRAVEVVPSLEALRSRTSEVWLRPAVAPRRLSRPVFAPPADSAPPCAVPEDIAPNNTRQPRPRLTFRERSRMHPDTPEPSAPMGETVKREVVSSAAARSIFEASPAMKPTPEARPNTIDAPPTARAASSIRPGAPPIATTFEPPVDETSRSATQPETQRPVAVDAARVERPAPSAARRVRRAIFRVLAGLRAKSRADQHQIWTRPTLQLVSETPARQGVRWSASPSSRTVFPTIADPAVPSHRTTPTIRIGPKPDPHVARRRPRLVWSQESSQAEPPRQASPPLVDERWPAFPPKTLSPPPVAELPSPRLEQLAREQEEGRWSV